MVKLSNVLQFINSYLLAYFLECCRGNIVEKTSTESQTTSTKTSVTTAEYESKTTTPTPTTTTTTTITTTTTTTSTTTSTATTTKPMQCVSDSDCQENAGCFIIEPYELDPVTFEPKTTCHCKLGYLLDNSTASFPKTGFCENLRTRGCNEDPSKDYCITNTEGWTMCPYCRVNMTSF